MLRTVRTLRRGHHPRLLATSAVPGAGESGAPRLSERPSPVAPLFNEESPSAHPLQAPGAPPPSSASGLQKQVLSLYRRALRFARTARPFPENQALVEFVKLEFRNGAKEVRRSDFRKVEHLLRQAEKQLKTYAKMGIAGISVKRFP
jgi:succinate dehydrogenase assembly factor 1